MADWMRWLRDPGHWERFYDGLATRTYAAIAKEMCDGKWPDEAVELAVEDITARMRAEGVPEDVVVSYRAEYFRHRGQLLEIAREIADVLPDERTDSHEALPPLPTPLSLATAYWDFVAQCLRPPRG
jgi:tagatose-1,6-bisphosphate aldolase non-catalytic subunit AgaZ/GatZ